MTYVKEKLVQKPANNHIDKHHLDNSYGGFTKLLCPEQDNYVNEYLIACQHIHADFVFIKKYAIAKTSMLF